MHLNIGWVKVGLTLNYMFMTELYLKTNIIYIIYVNMKEKKRL